MNYKNHVDVCIDGALAFFYHCITFFPACLSYEDLKQMSEALKKDLTNTKDEDQYNGESFIMGKQVWVRWLACDQLKRFHPDAACSLIFCRRNVMCPHYTGHWQYVC